MKVIRDIKQMSLACQRLRRKGKSIGFVPTMGALHAGHLSLVKEAGRVNDIVVVSIFVNPMQFAPQEDFRRYPRPIKKDIALCRKSGVDFVFYPDAVAMYPEGFQTSVAVERLSRVLCGKSRPRHFRGVTTVVAKLFNVIQPEVAYFGQKDAQQAIIIQRMSADLNFPLRIKIMPTIREKDGLAISSRNIYLSRQERKEALVLSQSLDLAKGLIKNGIKDAHKIIAKMEQFIKSRKSASVDYISIVEAAGLKPVKKICGDCLIALAVWIGKTRLIDNAIIRNA